MTDLDEVLERFQRGGLEYGGGLSNHGPMAAEALVALGHPALLTGLVDLYAPQNPMGSARPHRQHPHQQHQSQRRHAGSWQQP